MIQHIGEVLAVLTVAFVLGSVVGWIAYRWIDRTDYAFDQRDLADAIGRFLGIRTPAPADEPVVAGVAAAPIPAVAARSRAVPAEPKSEPLRQPEPAPRPEPALRSEPAPRPAPIPLPVEVVDWLTLEPAGKTEAAEDLRKRVQSSSRAIAWREARDERLRPGESATQIVAAGPISDPGSPADKAEEARRDGSVPRETRPSPAALAPTRPRKTDDTADPDEPWAAAPQVWPGDLHRLSATDAVPAHLALPSSVPSEIRLALPPVATPLLAADDIWSDDDDAQASREDDGALAPLPPPAADRPPALDSAPRDRDNLRRIKGIGQGFEKRLNQLGIYRYAQIVAWTDAQQAWISAELGFPGRVERDDWPKQASRLVKGTESRAGSEPEVARDP
jgi:predicted flap endonuclease-1-like 5' DNA nuclease